MSATETTETTAPEILSREDALAKIFSAKPEHQDTVLFGVAVQLRNPTLEEVLDAQAQEDKKRAAVDMLIRYVFLPNGEKLFGEEHVESLLGLPFGKDLQDVQKAIMKLSGIEVKGEDKSQTEAVPA